MIDADVLIVGAGPTGLATAALLTARGHRVLVIERHAGPYGLPRAGHIDHEVFRILDSIGAAGPIAADAPDPEPYVWYGAERQVLFSFPFGAPSRSGYQADWMIFQPVLDTALLERIPRDRLQFGWEVVALAEDGDGVVVTCAEQGGAPGGRRATGRTRRLSARYVIAADGAASGVRDLLGIARTGPEIDERWYTVDCEILRPLPRGIYGQWCEPSRPSYVGPLGRRHYRFEMKVLPWEDPSDFNRERAFDLLAQWGVGPEHVRIHRDVIYGFQAKTADRWRDGRVVIAGDAAHTMPPFMGQGLCSGFRDAANLAWKLDLVLEGEAADALLDSYESERRPHVRRWQEISLAVGALSCEIDPERARERDRRFAEGSGIELPSWPAPGPGVFVGGRDGFAEIPDRLLPQSAVRLDVRVDLLHRVVGEGFLLLARDRDSVRLSPHAAETLRTIGATVVVFGDAQDEVGDVTGDYRAFFDELDSDLLVARPDYYIFGAARADRGDALVAELAARLQLTARDASTDSARRTR